MTLWTAVTEFLLKIPPYKIINPDEGGVRLRGGKYKRTLTNGFYLKFPIYDEIQTVCIKEQPINLPNQSIESKDGKLFAISGVIRYEVADPRKALLEILDYDISLQNLAMKAIAGFVSHSASKDCTYDNICEEVNSELELVSEDWGLEIIDFGLTDMGEHKIYRIMTHDTPISIIPQEEV